MQRTYVLAHPIQYTPGQSAVMIPVHGVSPAIPNLERVDTTKEALFPNGGSIADIDAAIKTATQAALAKVYAGDTVTVLLSSEWAAQQAAAAPAAPATP